MAKSVQRLKARKLRLSGSGIRSIAQKLQVSRSSVSVWCRDIELTPQQLEVLFERKKDGVRRGQILGAAANKRKKEAVIIDFRQRGAQELSRLSDREILLTGLGIYWGEGAKGSSSVVSVVNSDPRIILYMYQWFQRAFKVDKIMFSPRIFINAQHRSREEKVVNYWSRLLRLPKRQFGKTVFIKVKNKKVYENYDTYYGVLALKVRKGANIKYRILGYLDALGAYSIKTPM